jgi:hypothetical protein
LPGTFEAAQMASATANGVEDERFRYSGVSVAASRRTYRDLGTGSRFQWIRVVPSGNVDSVCQSLPSHPPKIPHCDKKSSQAQSRPTAMRAPSCEQDAWVPVDKPRPISSSVLANSNGRSAGNPKHFVPPSMAGSQRQLFSTGKQRNAEIGRWAKAASTLVAVPSGRYVWLSTRSILRELNKSVAARKLLAK